MKILAISGSLRHSSSNTQLLQALALLAPAGTTITLFTELAQFPHFNPDLDQEPAPHAVAAFRNQLGWADAVVISTPEYAHGVPGSLKNALDWIVSSGEFVEKSVCLINASQQATHAYESLAETLKVMLAVLVPDGFVTVPVQGRKLTAAEIAANPEFSVDLCRVIRLLVDR